jgi:hypothetical protein
MEEVSVTRKSEIGVRRLALLLSCCLPTVACGLSDVATWGRDEKDPTIDGAAFGSSQSVDRWKELLVDDPAIVGDARSSNAVKGAPFSFRSQLEWLAGSDDAAPAFTRAWLEQWNTVTAVGDAKAPVTPRPEVEDVLVKPWTAMSDGDDLDLSRAPFRLLAIVNRLDLAGDACSGSGGELRYVYTAVDPSSGASLDMTVNVEIPYPGSRSAHDWALEWHRVAQVDDDSYAGSLVELMQELRDHVAPAEARVRTNEAALSAKAGWELREFHVAHDDNGDAALTEVTLDSTPRDDLRPGVLADALQVDSSRLFTGSFTLPSELQAGAASLPTPDFVWSVPGINDEVVRAFSQNTCNGCHGGETEALPFQHIAAGKTEGAPVRLSRFLNDPRGGADELARRGELLSSMLATQCVAVPGAYH